ncbi:transglutaminase-like domain-containing protein [Vannielia litorea]|uniref:Transglutaminase-like enzyme, putative cysteine protease n=1 Tax=Vannielia litorea TaxID=1217970 RepID=A0A1N6HQ65_9RHOB|nr:transglutaminase domain-containing protein [Vannielia litorea]SIO21998.1 Transglutaminase-like enzyme, putative cysteine protease [Vannielia litorea]
MIGRRRVLASGGAAALVAMAPRGLWAGYAPQAGAWRTFEIVTRVELPRGGKTAQAWVPVPSHRDDTWTVPDRNLWVNNADEVKLVEGEGTAFVQARWAAGEGPAVLEVTSRVATRSRSVALEASTGATLTGAERAELTAPTELLPTDGIVLETAQGIVAGRAGDLEKARAIYDWVVESTERNPETRGCGLGDIASMLHMGDLTGKCADLNALFVGLCRAAGLPARDLYGLRVAPSDFGYRALGAGSENVTGAQHCRAEVFVEGTGWVPADPADVRKVVLQEDGGLSLADAKVQDARRGLFGAAEGNWLCLNTAHDVVLPGAADDAPLPFLMYPQAEIGGERLDELAPDAFVYTITARELT